MFINNSLDNNSNGDDKNESREKTSLLSVPVTSSSTAILIVQRALIRNRSFLIKLVLIVLCTLVLVTVLKSAATTINCVLNSSPSPRGGGSSGSGYNDDTSSRMSAFDRIRKDSYEPIVIEESTLVKQNNNKNNNNNNDNNNNNERKQFNVTLWKTLYNRTSGGLTREDRIMLGDIYYTANSVFEYGLGESTRIADYVGVPRYAGVDSHITWVTMIRSEVSSRFRFYYGDIGRVRAWGFPADNLTKAAFQYQVVPLASEPEAFDVYMVDGRYRVACVLVSFLHASLYGSYDSIVLLHDCYQPNHSPQSTPAHSRRKTYYILDQFFELYHHSKNLLCAYKRRDNVTDEQIYELWQQYQDVVV